MGHCGYENTVNVYESEQDIGYSKKTNKIREDNTKHYPNQDEASVLRKIMSETGLTEEKIREIKKYRVMLSDAQKQGQKPKTSAVKKWYLKRIKEACKKTGLVPQHPKTLKVLDEILYSKYNGSWWKPWYIRNDKMTAKTVVRDFAK